jgi:hypothetical protein
MKLKLFGLTIFEMERDSSGFSAAPRFSTRAAFAEPPPSTPATSTPLRSSAELHQSAEMLPRTRRGTIDVEASLQLLGITDPKVLWQQRFKPGTAGAALKCILGAKGRKPGQSPQDQVSPDLYEYPAEKLPLLPGTRKLDFAACLAMFDIQDPSVLWKKRFGPNSAGGRIKMCLRASGFVPNSAGHNSSPTDPRNGETPQPLQEDKSPANPDGKEVDRATLQKDAQGNIDIAASLQALGISDPRTLWKNRVEPGSARHALKKEIFRSLAKGKPVAGITRQDIGVSA